MIKKPVPQRSLDRKKREAEALKANVARRKLQAKAQTSKMAENDGGDEPST